MRRSTTGSTSRRWRVCSRASSHPAARSCPRACPATTRPSTPRSARTAIRSQPPDIAKAQDLIKQAGAEGTEVTVYGNNDDPTDKVTQAYADMLNEIGLDAEPEILDGGVYFQTVGNEKTEAQTGFTNWFQDFPHPLNFYFLVDGDTIQPTNNQNFGNVDDPKINDEIDRLSLETDLEAVAGDWSELDQYLIEPPQSYIAPYGHRKLATFVSERIDFEGIVQHPVYQNDYSTFALTE